ncbi:MAG: alpha/beta hydrolase [Chloroflexi bacterium]|nr:alpha/beta hydrolase [Chloroflexota bacterium]MDA0241779.1 alpha/beta hydrolase [Chloroflexota bacterium]
MSIATLGDSLIHYEVLGRGEPIVFIHGWLGSWRYWWPSMQSLSSRHRTFAFDLWGFGDSSKATDKYSFDAYVDMLSQFVDKLGIIQPVTLVGHSLGAAVALRYAQREPERVRRIAAVALPVQGNTINDRLTNSDSATILSRTLGVSYPELDMEIRKTDTAAMNNLARELLNYDFGDEIMNCPRPLLVVFGDQDTLIKQPAFLPEPTNSLAYIALDSCSHFPMLEQAVKFNRLVLDFTTNADGDLQKIAPKEHWQRRTR